MRIRHARLEDLDEIMRLAEQWLNPLWQKEEKRHRLTTFLRFKFLHHHVVVAEDTTYGLIMGFVIFITWHDWLTMKHRLIIEHVYVDEDRRREGVGTKMFHFILTTFDPDTAVVDTKPDKFPQAAKLYRKMGFEENPKRLWLERVKK